MDKNMSATSTTFIIPATVQLYLQWATCPELLILSMCVCDLCGWKNFIRFWAFSRCYINIIRVSKTRLWYIIWICNVNAPLYTYYFIIPTSRLFVILLVTAGNNVSYFHSAADIVQFKILLTTRIFKLRRT